MRQFNFVIIFIFCLVIALFTVENSQPATIQITPGLQVSAAMPLATTSWFAIELLIASGLGAFVVWLFSVWTHSNQVRQKNMQIQELESKIKQYQTEIQSLKLPLLHKSGDSLTQEAQIAQ
ncbi:MAG: LapA family protein [Cyanomargarita calcarea GSE-NOS-MK-12-04C]|jgi:TRAP-type C4-dicarboxylate transport system permease small subunit|uniref:LapA family protein n=1 Tax=Cyanomargarita calcarea GSE-NOS-MK-12-04C TaxID=2839659 RepID=A0A951QLZ6_9CYAN|nr:LapA family protein [Cyanomargarita calcarea GSE-NOS-MK-12-04C]